MIKRLAVLALFGLLAMSTGAFADEGRDESGKGKKWHEENKGKKWHEEKKGWDEGRGRDERYKGGGHSYFHQHGRTSIPKGHLPPPGECRIWYPDRPAGHQPPPFKCGQGRGRVEPGGWLITPGPQPREVKVDVYDPRRPGVVIDVGIFDARSGSMIRVIGAK
jgi:hypothetical protein